MWFGQASNDLFDPSLANHWGTPDDIYFQPWSGSPPGDALLVDPCDERCGMAFHWVSFLWGVFSCWVRSGVATPPGPKFQGAHLTGAGFAYPLSHICDHLQSQHVPFATALTCLWAPKKVHYYPRKIPRWKGLVRSGLPAWPKWTEVC